MNFKFTNILYVCVTLGLCACGVSPNFGKTMNAKNYFESKPQIALAEAGAKGRLDRIKQIIADGADIDAQGKEGMTALIWALVNQNKKGFQALLEAGANPNLQLSTGDSAMSYAAMHADTWYIEAVFKHGGNPNLVNPVEGETPIYESIGRLRTEHVKMLIDAGADLNFQRRNGDTPIIMAAKINQYCFVYAFLQAGADPTLKNIYGNTVLYFIRNNRIDPKSDGFVCRAKVVDFLKAKGVDVENGN